MNHKIKTYQLESITGDQSDFVLKKIEDIFDLSQGIEDVPHRHDYYTLILVKNGKGTHTIDFHEFPIQDRSIHFIYPGQVHQVAASERPQGWVINFTSEFLFQNGISNDLVNRVYLYNTSGYSPPLPLNENDYTSFEQLVTQIIDYSKRELKFQYQALGALLKLFFINITSLCSFNKMNEIEQATGSINLFIEFKKLIETEYKSKHKVSDYADSLSVSSDYLNRYIKTQSGKSAKEFIQDKIIVEAKRLLLFTEESNKELAFDLGFEEPAHFSNFFKKNVGVTPGHFRNNNKLSSK